MKKIILFSVFFIFCFFYSKSDVCTSLTDGAWNSPETWSCGHKPTCGDIVYIEHLVTVTATDDLTGCGSPLQIIIKACGTLSFQSGRKLKLPCGSGVTMEPASGACPAGKIMSDGGGASESLQICGVTVWQASNGTVTGPLIFGSGLPIELLNFNASLINLIVEINWSTASETNNAFFTIERTKDGELWAEIANVNGAGNSNSQIDYTQTDFSPLSGISYYRLKQTDYDGGYSYSNIQVVQNGNASNEADITPFPNPSDGNSFNVEFTGFSDEELLVVVRDIQGKIHYSKVYLIADDKSIFEVDLENKLPAGIYFITASSDEDLVSTKIIVK